MNSWEKSRICIVGAGAIGGYLGVRLARGGARLSVLARGKTLEAIRSHGWVLEDAGERLVATVRAAASPEALGPQDIIIIAVKAYALQDIAPMVAAMCHDETIVIPAINGIPWWFTEGMGYRDLPRRLTSLDPEGRISAAIDARRVVGCVVYPSCYSPEPGVSHHSSGHRLVFGEIAGPLGSNRLDQVVACFGAAGLAAEATDRIREAVWEKLLGNACFNPVSMLTGSQTDLMIDDPAIHRLFVALMEEVIAVGAALAIQVNVTPAQRLAVTRKLGGVKTSMLQDAEAGRPVEVEAIVGALVELAGSLKVATPIASTVYALARMRARTLALL